jgi:hypothetical protein
MADTDHPANEEEIVNEEVQEEPTQDEAPEEVQTEEPEAPVEEEPNSEPEEESQEEPQEEVDQNLSRRAAKRAGDLKFKQIFQQQQNQPRPQAPQNQGINYQDMIDADPEVYTQLQQASQQFGEQQYRQGLQEANTLRFQTRLEVDAPKVEAKYPALDKNSPDFNPAVADSFNEMYLSAVGYDKRNGTVQNPNIRYSDYIDAMFELVNEAASRKVETTTRNVTRQAAQTGLRPDGSSAKRLDLNKDPSQMTDEELDAAMAKAGLAPKKKR